MRNLKAGFQVTSSVNIQFRQSPTTASYYISDLTSWVRRKFLFRRHFKRIFMLGHIIHYLLNLKTSVLYIFELLKFYNKKKHLFREQFPLPQYMYL